MFSLSIMKKYHFYHIKRFSEEKLSWAYTELCYTSLFLKTSTLLFTSIFLENDNFLFTQITLLSEYSQQSCLSDATKSKGSSNIVLSLEWIFSWNCRIVWCDYMLVLCLSSPKAYYYLKKMAGKQWYVMNDALLRWWP